MNLINILFYITMFLWFGSEIFLLISLRSQKSDQQGKDHKSLIILWVTIFFSIFFAFGFQRSFNATISTSPAIEYVGLALVIIGVLGRLYIVRSLGKYFTVDVTIRDEHKIKKDGFYGIVRHPSYVFSLLTFIGLGLFLNNWISLAIAFIPPFIAFSYRIQIEEKALVEAFGTEYENYKQTTKRLIPFIY